jgi:hypothetical protein
MDHDGSEGAVYQSCFNPNASRQVTPWKLLGGSGISNHDPNTRGGMWVDDNGNLRSQDEDTREDGAWVGTKPGAHPSWASVDEAWTTPGEHATTATGATTGAPAMAAGHQLYQPIGDHEGALEQDAAGTLYRWPSPRMHAAGWVDANDAAWMFGGLLGCCDSTTQAQGVLVSELSTVRVMMTFLTQPYSLHTVY